MENWKINNETGNYISGNFSHPKQTGMLVENFQSNPSEVFVGVA